MWLKIELDLYNNQSFYDDIERLFLLVLDKKHDLVVYDQDYICDVVESSFFKDYYGEIKQEKIFNEVLEKSLTKTANHLDKNNWVKINQENIKSELQKLQQQLFIIVEDSESDRGFLEGVINCYKSETVKLRNAIDAGWVKFEHSGGATRIKKTLDDIIKTKARVFVLFDSDKKHKEEEYSEHIKSIINLCNSNNIKYHVLYKREIENYLPYKDIDCFPDNVIDVVREISKLSDDQLDFYDIEKGFENKDNPQEHHKGLYNGIKENLNYELLRKGLNINGFDVKGKIFTYFNDKVNRKLLESRCSHHDKEELLKVITIIKRLL